MAAGNNLKELSLERRGQLTQENLSIGTATWAYLAEMEETHDTKPFFTAVRNFYVATITKMLKKFPFNDTLMKDLTTLQPEKTPEFNFSTVATLAKRFPQIGLSDNATVDLLREEFKDYQLNPNDLPTVHTYKAADGTEKSRVGLYWSEVGRMTIFDGKERFGQLFKLMSGLLSIPCSNADSERGFSVLRKIHTDQRACLEQTTIVSLMSLKFNCDNCCSDQIFEELLTKCKKATVNYLRLNK